MLVACIALLISGAILATYFLQPARLTALILARASNALHLELHTTGPGSYALRPEPRLVLPGLSASVPGESAPFFRSDQVELALPWDTLRGRSTAISSIVLKSPDIDLPALQRWLATQPPSTTPFKLPTLTRGLQIHNGLLRTNAWRIEHLDAALPMLADGKPATLDASGDFVRGKNTSRFALTLASAPSAVHGRLRIDDSRIAFKADGELPSLTATASLRVGDTFLFDIAGAMQRIPDAWTRHVDSSFAKPGDTPFAVTVNAQTPTSTSGNAASVTAAPYRLQVQLKFGDAKRQPALTLGGDASAGATIDASLHGQLSSWPDAWPALPQALAANTAPFVFKANYHGSIFKSEPVTFDIARADASLQGSFRIDAMRAWIANDFAAALPPVEATLRAPQIDVGGMQLRGVQMDIHDDVAPSQPATKPTVIAPKS